MTPSERATELKCLLQISYDLSERIFQLLKDRETKAISSAYIESESVSVLLDAAMKESIYGSN